MPASGVLERIAQQQGEDLNNLIPRLLAEHKTPFRIAVALGVYPNTIRQWLTTHGYRPIDGEWKKDEASHVS